MFPVCSSRLSAGFESPPNAPPPRQPSQDEMKSVAPPTLCNESLSQISVTRPVPNRGQMLRTDRLNRVHPMNTPLPPEQRGKGRKNTDYDENLIQSDTNH